MMGIFLDDERGGLVLADIDDVTRPILDALPAFARGAGADVFLSPSPVDAEDESDEAAELSDDWDEFIAPDLHAHFDDQLARVASDIDAAKASIGVPGAVDVVIPPLHLEAWFGALNQARLAMHAEHGCEALDAREFHDPNEENDEEMASVMHHFMFYRFLQEMIMQAMRVTGQIELGDDDIPMSSGDEDSIDDAGDDLWSTDDLVDND